MSQNLRIGILGPVSRAVTWEKYLRPHPSVNEVIIADDIAALGGVHACILLDESHERFSLALNLVRNGLHLFMVGRLPMKTDEAEKIFYTAEESGIVIQYSNWSVFSEGTRWMRQKLPTFDLYQSVREVEGLPAEPGHESFLGYLLEDIALAQNWSGTSLNKVQSQMAVSASGEPFSIQCFLRFENNATASLFLLVNSSENRHIRYISSRGGSLRANVYKKHIQFRSSDRQNQADENYRYDEPEPARYAITQFIKSIQLKREPDYSGFQGVQLARAIRIIEEGLRR